MTFSIEKKTFKDLGNLSVLQLPDFMKNSTSSVRNAKLLGGFFAPLTAVLGRRVNQAALLSTGYLSRPRPTKGEKNGSKLEKILAIELVFEIDL